MFTARYELSPYITQIRFVIKGLTVLYWDRKTPFCYSDVTLQVCSGAVVGTGEVVGALAAGGSRGGTVRWWQCGTTDSSSVAGTVKGAKSRPPPPPPPTVRTG